MEMAILWTMKLLALILGMIMVVVAVAILVAAILLVVGLMGRLMSSKGDGELGNVGN